MRIFFLVLGVIGLCASSLFAGERGARPSFLDRSYTEHKDCEGPFSVWIDPKTPRFALVSDVGIAEIGGNKTAMRDCVALHLAPVLQQAVLSGQVVDARELQIDLFGPNGGKFSE
ncbi:hypothetical protein [uncultured Roseobacter sp.]|uniref:hypothetical protein n=1 Tax=uncultured Roseobacter sp. TaxID=114847 RepID=UPI002623B6B3|nr:hypothetical protein [uncultured Roseobacter sp.]